MRDMRRRDGGDGGGRAVCGVQRMRLPSVPALLRVREERGQPAMPTVQNQIQAPQRQVLKVINELINRSNVELIVLVLIQGALELREATTRRTQTTSSTNSTLMSSRKRTLI